MNMPKFGKIGRYTVCILLVIAIFLAYEVRLFQWQIVEGEEFEQLSLSNLTDTIEIEAARGEILDRNGKVLAGNKTSYNIVYDALDMIYAERNATIIKVIDLLEERGEKWRDRLPIVLDADGNYQFAEGKEDEIETLKSQDMLNMADYATADDCIAELAKRYDCEGYSKVDTRNVASVRYSMTRDAFSRNNPYVIAENVSADTVGVISERSDELKGIKPRVAVTRDYGTDGTLAPHVVGYTGAITDTQYKAAVENGQDYDSTTNISGYKLNDTYGRSGIENAFEEVLRGQRGRETIYTDDTGAVKSTSVTTQPKEGNTVQLTLDADLQRAANISLKKNIEGNTEARNGTAGAAVAINVKDFGVLASSSYPTFDVNLYTSDEDYVNKIGNDSTQPQFDRALQGVFVPGSIFKPMVALAALQEQVISAGSTYTCNGWFEYFDLRLRCLNDELGPKNVYSALAESCNVFFCNVGLNLTIAKMDAYAEYFGLGELTGVELPEVEGIMSNPQEYKERHLGVEWTSGVSAQAAIGQADNLFTPLQLAVYCATIANGGKRMQAHFLDQVTDYTRKEVIEKHQPKELYDAGLSSDVLGVVQQGMLGSASYGTASDLFSDYPVSVACKTGTAENSDNPDEGGKQANISFICYAPAEDPEIAVAVMLEYGNKGSYAKKVAKDILDQYFGYYTWDEEGNRYDGSTGDMVDDDGKVLKTKAVLDQEKAQKESQEKTESSETSSSSSGMTSSQDDPVSSAPNRDNIPDTPFTGETSSLPESSGTESGVSSTVSSGDDPNSGSSSDSPYYTGSG